MNHSGLQHREVRRTDPAARNGLPHRVGVLESTARGPCIGILYPSGWGNIGDEAVLQATFEGLRRRWPRVVLRAFTLHPALTAANHGVDSEALTGLNRPLFCAPRDEGPLPVRAARAIARRTRSIPLLGNVTEWASHCTAEVVFESTSLLRARRWLATADLLLASGGGQLDDVWGGTWGQPYALARWAWLARRAGVPFGLLSVGYGGASTWLSRRLLQYAVRRAAYCSVRDEGSRILTARLGVRRDLPVVPDLAFALRPGSPLPARRPGYDIGISPMTYLRPGSWPNEDPDEYRRLIALWADLVSARVAVGDRVHLFVSAPEDMPAVWDVWELLSEAARAGSSIAEAASPDALLDFYRGLDVVISSRLHGVLLAIVAARPVLALSHERKVRAVMSDAGASPFCAELTETNVDQITEMLRDLTEHLEVCGQRLRGYATQASAAVRQQEELLPQLLRQSQ